MEETKDVPPELVCEILTRLPVKSLMRFKAVCKPWYSLIEDPDFVALHFEKSTTRLLTEYQLDSLRQVKFSLLSNETLDVLVPNIDLPYAGLEGYKGHVRACRPCNGILCVQLSYIKILLWNPATTEIRLLPESSVPLPVMRRAFAEWLGFGYDSTGANDFKVVRILWLEGYDEDYNPNSDLIVACELYELKTDAWRKLDVVVPARPHDDLELSQLGVDGMFAWASGLEEDGEEMLIVFHMTDERFSTAILPGNYLGVDYDDRPRRGFSMLNGSIVLIDHLCHRMPTSYKIWVLNGMGAEATWTALYSLDLVPELGWPLGFHRSGQLFCVSTGGELVSFDPVNRTIKYLGIQGDGPYCFYVFEYKESLVKLH